MTKKPESVTLATIASLMEMPLMTLRCTADITESSYQVRRQAKPAGGHRLIAAPSDALKLVQRRLLDRVLYRLPGVIRGDTVFARSSVANAKSHRNFRHTTSLDVRNAFPSVRQPRVLAALRKEGFTRDAAMLVSKLCTLHGSLPQGAPTSPALLGLVLQPMHDRIDQRFSASGLHFTRYADNLTISGSSELGDAERVVERELRLLGLKLNDEKTERGGRTQPVVITGVETGRAAKVPPAKVASFHAQIAKAVRDDGTDQVASVRGMLSWVRSVNPRQAHALYSETVPLGSAMRVALRRKRRRGRKTR